MAVARAAMRVGGMRRPPTVAVAAGPSAAGGAAGGAAAGHREMVPGAALRERRKGRREGGGGDGSPAALEPVPWPACRQTRRGGHPYAASPREAAAGRHLKRGLSRAKFARSPAGWGGRAVKGKASPVGGPGGRAGRGCT